MNNLINLFQFPEKMVIDIPVTKLSLKNNENCTLSERKLLDGANIQSIRIKALIKQETANIQHYQSSEESYVEVYVIEVILQKDQYTKIYKQISHLLHKLIPHHCIISLVSDENELRNVSLATKSISKNSNALRVIQNEYYSNHLDFFNVDFVEALDFKKANKHDLKAFYLYYLQVFQNYNLLAHIDTYKLRNYDVTEQMLLLQEQIKALEYEIKSAKKALATATQMNEKVRINSDIHQLKNSIQELKNKLN